jgi:hypothetical protein
MGLNELRRHRNHAGAASRALCRHLHRRSIGVCVDSLGLRAVLTERVASAGDMKDDADLPLEVSD